MSNAIRQSRIGNNGVYLIQRGTEFAAVDPLRGKACVCNETAAKLITSVCSGECLVEDVVSEDIRAFIQGLSASPKHCFQSHRESIDNYHPTAITLDLTPSCTLRCTYCYANAGTPQIQMDWACAKAGIRFVSENSRLLGVNPRITFHGSGEPTCAWDLLVRCVDYFHQLCRDSSLQGQIYMSTNGCYSARKRAWIMSEVSNLSLSFDILEDVQNAQRPFRNGAASYPLVAETAREFNSAGYPFGIRTTITTLNVERQVEMVRYAVENHGCHEMSFEPVAICGRCELNDIGSIDPEVFTRHFIEARKIAKVAGAGLSYSGFIGLDQLRRSFCGASEPMFAVRYDGTVTACYGFATGIPGFRVFEFGQYNAPHDIFVFDRERLSYLSSLTVERSSRCHDCFCQYWCAGDCPAMQLGDSEESSWVDNKCKINAIIAAHAIFDDW